MPCRLRESNFRGGPESQGNGRWGAGGEPAERRSTISMISQRWPGVNFRKAFNSRRLSIVSREGSSSLFCSSARDVEVVISHLCREVAIGISSQRDDRAQTAKLKVCPSTTEGASETRRETHH